MTVDDLLDDEAIAVGFGVESATVRKWRQRGKLPRRGTGERGKALSSLRDAAALYVEMHPPKKLVCEET